MQHVHRSTLWRRSRKPPSRLGRKRSDVAEDEFNLDLLAKMLVWLARSGGSAGYPGGRIFVPMNEVAAVKSKRDIKLARRHIAMNWQCDEMSIPCALLIVSAWDAFHIDARRRGRSYDAKIVGQLSPREKLAVAQLVRAGIDKKEAERMVRQAVAEREPWIAEFMRGDADEPTGWSRASCNVPCPSRFFRISRRMVSYWRRDAEMRELLTTEIFTVARHFLREAMGLKIAA